MFLRFLILLLIAFSSASFAQPKENRVALVVGNSAYKSSPLRNPTNDAKDMAVKLKSMGFTVIERSNLTVKQIGSTLREFRAKLTPASVALVFYAGHGLQIKGENYLPAVDADITGEDDVPTQSLAVRQIMDVLGDAKTRLNLVFLDACRNNPFARSFRSASDGLNRVNAPSGTLISFATRPGSVASDGAGRNGLYTGALLQQMSDQGQPIEQVLKKVVSQVKAGSNNQQEPWMEGSIEGDFCFAECAHHMTQSEHTNLQTQSSAPYVPMTLLPSCAGAKIQNWDNCIGNFKYPNGNVYFGEFHHGKRHGFGRIRILAKGQSDPQNIRSVVPATFEGLFKEGSINGRGVLILDTGQRFEGEFSSNQYVGNPK